MKISKNHSQIILKIAGILYIILFVYAATSKLIDFEHFKLQLHKSPFISNYAHGIAWLIPTMEYSIAGLFLFPRFLQTAFYFSFSLMSLFTIYIFSVLNFSSSIPCSCGGILSNLGWKDHLLFNIIFVLIALLGILITSKQKAYHL